MTEPVDWVHLVDQQRMMFHDWAGGLGSLGWSTKDDVPWLSQWTEFTWWINKRWCSTTEPVDWVPFSASTQLFGKQESKWAAKVRFWNKWEKKATRQLAWQWRHNC